MEPQQPNSSEEKRTTRTLLSSSSLTVLRALPISVEAVQGAPQSNAACAISWPSMWPPSITYSSDLPFPGTSPQTFQDSVWKMSHSASMRTLTLPQRSMNLFSMLPRS